jgi:hypothetical protein
MLKQLIEEKILIARQKYPDAKGMKDDHIKQMLTHGRQLRYDALQARWRVRLLAAD